MKWSISKLRKFYYSLRVLLNLAGEYDLFIAETRSTLSDLSCAVKRFLGFSFPEWGWRLVVCDASDIDCCKRDLRSRLWPSPPWLCTRHAWNCANIRQPQTIRDTESHLLRFRLFRKRTKVVDGNLEGKETLLQFLFLLAFSKEVLERVAYESGWLEANEERFYFSERSKFMFTLSSWCIDSSRNDKQTWQLFNGDWIRAWRIGEAGQWRKPVQVFPQFT